MQKYYLKKEIKRGLVYWLVRGLLVVGFLILLGRLAELQVIKGQYFLNLSDGNRTRRVPISAKRGEIHARGGEILVGNKLVQKKIIFDQNNGFEKIKLDQPNSEDNAIEQ